MDTKTYTIKVINSIRPRAYKLKIFGINNKMIAFINFDDNFEGLINYIYRFLENNKKEITSYSRKKAE